MRVVAICLVLSAVFVGAPVAAWACSPAWSFERHRPLEGTTAPSNAILQFVGPITPSSIRSAEAGPEGQALAAVPLIDTQNTTRGILDNLVQVQLPPADPAGERYRVVLQSDFQTFEIFVDRGGPADEAPPQLRGPASVGGRFVPGNPAAGACFPNDHFEVNMAVPAATDDREVATYTIYETTQGIMRPLSSVLARSAGTQQSIGTYVDPTPGRRCFGVLARDLAGNTSDLVTACADFAIAGSDAGLVEPDATEVVLDATEVVLDGGFPDGDGGFGNPEAGPGGALDDADDEGCACAMGAPRSVPIGGWFWFSLLVIGLRHRRPPSSET